MLSVYPSRGDRELPFVPFSRGAACSRSRAADERQLYFRAPPSRSQTSTRCVDALRERDDVCDRVMEIPLMSLFYHLSSRSSTPLALVKPLSRSTSPSRARRAPLVLVRDERRRPALLFSFHRAPVWNILDNYVGRGILAASAVVVNICVFTAGHNAGTTLYDGIPAEAVELMHRLRVVTLNALGNPKKVGGFGGGVREWIKKHLRPNRRALWTTFKGEIDDACVHLCMFTSITKKNFVRSNWFERFGHLVQFISGKRGAGARLKQVLTKDGKYDEALAKRMEEDHRELCRKNAALTGFGGKYETEKQRNARALNCFGSKNETEKQRNARALNCALHGFGSKNETEKQKNAHALNGFGSKNETEKQRNATSNLGNVGSRTTDGVQGRNVPPGAKCRVCGCDIGTGRALTLSVGVSNLRPCGSYFCAGKCNKAIYFNIDRLKEMITKCNEHQPLQGGVTGFVESFAKLWFKKKKEKKPKGKEKK